MLTIKFGEDFPGFNYHPKILNNYIEASGIFTILLKDGTIVHFTPDNIDEFQEWLKNQNVSNVRE